MAYSHVLLGAQTGSSRVAVRRIGLTDLKDALSLGLSDFNAMPTHAIFLCLIYPIIGLVAARAAFGYSVLPLIYPLVTGFALVGPFAALGLYELSRRRESGLDVSVARSFDVLRSSSIGAITALGFLLLMVFGVWMAVANAIYIATFGIGLLYLLRLVNRAPSEGEQGPHPSLVRRIRSRDRSASVGAGGSGSGSGQ